MKKVRGGGFIHQNYLTNQKYHFLHYLSKVRFPSQITRHCKKVSGGETKLVLFISLIKRTRHQDKHAEV